MIGQTISHYKIVEKLGEGGMGVVYKAEDTKLGRTVALKFLAAHLLQDEESRARFIREAKAAAVLDHPNICTVHEIDEADGHTFIAMAFVEGETLQEKIEAGPLKIDESLDIALQVARGLAAAHHNGVVHRDIKSANVMIAAAGPGADPQAKLLDFGLAQLATGSRLTKEGTTLGTTAYMSPEQAQGAEVDQRSDIWSLGVVLYEMVSGRLPFQGEHEQGILYAVLNEQAEPLTGVRTGVPKELERIAGKCLAKEPGSRYQHVDELLVDLRELQKERQSGESRLRGGAAPGSSVDDKPGSRALWYVAASAVVVALVAAGGAWLGVFGPGDQTPQEPMQVVPLTTYPGSETQPSFSPDGTQVAFSWDGPTGDNFDIYVKGLDSDTPVRLTSSPASDLWPSWSPDGRYIAFLQAGDDLIDPMILEGRISLLLIPAIGGPERRLAEITVRPMLQPHHHAWLPGGNGLVVADVGSPDEPSALFIVSIETGEKRRLTSPPVGSLGDSGPALSPDGQTLAFVRASRMFVSDLYALKLSEDFTPSVEPRRLTAKSGMIATPAWTPDGREIIFNGWVTNPGLWRIDVAGSSQPQRLIEAGMSAVTPAVYPPSNRVVFGQNLFNTDLRRMQRPNASSTPSPPTPFVSASQYEGWPKFSADSNRVAFESNRRGVLGIWVSDAEGSNPKLLHSEEGTWSGVPSWSPDGQRIAFNWNPEGQFDIYVISAAGGKPLQLTADPADDQFPTWSHDGRWVYFTSRRSGRYEVWRVSAAGGEAVQITQQGGEISFESPDGKFLYYSKGGYLTPSIWKVVVDGGEETRVIESVSFSNFAVVQRGIYFIEVLEADDRGAGYSLRFLDFASNSVETITALPVARDRLGGGLAVSPDERNILYNQLEDRRSDLMLIEGFR